MKISIKNGTLTAEAETLNDLTILMSLKEQKNKYHKRHQFVKSCHICGRRCKGKVGLAVHTRKCEKSKLDQSNA